MHMFQVLKHNACTGNIKQDILELLLENIGTVQIAATYFSLVLLPLQ